MASKQRKEEVNRSYSENALKMMRKRYLLTRDDGTQETPADMIERVSKSLAAIEKNYGRDAAFVKKIEGEFFDVLANMEFTPAGRTMTNSGARTSVVANCIVLPIEDSMEGIFSTLKEAALLQQAGAGLGFSFDRLRPAMAKTVRSQGVSSGPISFLRVYNEAFGIIKQQGRHGANMAMMSIDHPNILDFIRAKEIEGDIRNFNISVKITDEFMRKLEENPNEQWYCTWKKEWPGKYGRVKPQRAIRNPNGSVQDMEEVDITVGELFDEIVHYGWRNGEPGIVFIDTVNKTNPLPDLGPIEVSNPCGEQFLHPYDNCNLGSINLGVFVKDGKIDFKRLREVTRASVRMLDNVIDTFDFPVKAVTEMALKNRRIGLGIMGFADMLYQLGIRYDSEEGIKTAEKVMSVIQEESHKMSQTLAKEKGVFPNYKKSVHADNKVKMRNTALTTVAPTGSISMMLDTSSGIEPNFALAFIKQDKDGEQYPYLNRHFEAELGRRKFTGKQIDEIKREAVEKGTIQHMSELPQDLRDTFVVSMDISGEDHVRMQAAFQKHVDNSISKTINFPNSATHEDVKQSYITAWKVGCKSCTVYRDGSRTIQVLNVGDGGNITSIAEDPKNSVNKKEITISGDETRLTPRKRPGELAGRTYRLSTGYGKLYVTVNNDEKGKPFEVFATIGKSGGFFQEQSEAICRMVSLALRSGIDESEVIDNLKGIRGPMPVITEKGTILSLPDAIGRILEDHMGKSTIVSEVEEEVLVIASENPIADAAKSMSEYGHMPGCPDCGSTLVMAEGCISCKNCGYSRCT